MFIFLVRYGSGAMYIVEYKMVYIPEQCYSLSKAGDRCVPCRVEGSMLPYRSPYDHTTTLGEGTHQMEAIASVEGAVKPTRARHVTPANLCVVS